MSTGLKIIGTGIFFAAMSAGFFAGARAAIYLRKYDETRFESEEQRYKKSTDKFNVCNVHYGCYGGFGDCDNNENE